MKFFTKSTSFALLLTLLAGGSFNTQTLFAAYAKWNSDHLGPWCPVPLFEQSDIDTDEDIDMLHNDALRGNRNAAPQAIPQEDNAAQTNTDEDIDMLHNDTISNNRNTALQAIPQEDDDEDMDMNSNGDNTQQSTNTNKRPREVFDNDNPLDSDNKPAKKRRKLDPNTKTLTEALMLLPKQPFQELAQQNLHGMPDEVNIKILSFIIRTPNDVCKLAMTCKYFCSFFPEQANHLDPKDQRRVSTKKPIFKRIVNNIFKLAMTSSKYFSSFFPEQPNHLDPKNQRSTKKLIVKHIVLDSTCFNPSVSDEASCAADQEGFFHQALFNRKGNARMPHLETITIELDEKINSYILFSRDILNDMVPHLKKLKKIIITLPAIKKEEFAKIDCNKNGLCTDCNQKGILTINEKKVTKFYAENKPCMQKTNCLVINHRIMNSVLSEIRSYITDYNPKTTFFSNLKSITLNNIKNLSFEGHIDGLIKFYDFKRFYDFNKPAQLPEITIENCPTISENFADISNHMDLFFPRQLIKQITSKDGKSKIIIKNKK